MDKIVEWTEELCDLIEDLDPELFHTEWRKVSIPASVAAIRVMYYVGYVDQNADITYKRLHRLLTAERVQWDRMSKAEQGALLGRLGICSVMVYVHNSNIGVPV